MKSSHPSPSRPARPELERRFEAQIQLLPLETRRGLLTWLRGRRRRRRPRVFRAYDDCQSFEDWQS